MSTEAVPLPDFLTEVWPEAAATFDHLLADGRRVLWGTPDADDAVTGGHFEGGLLDGANLGIPASATRLWAVDVSAGLPEQFFEYVRIHVGMWRLYSVTRLHGR